MCKLHVRFTFQRWPPKPRWAPGVWDCRHSIPGQAVGPAGLSAVPGLVLCWVLPCLALRCLLNTIRGKKNYLRVAFCHSTAHKHTPPAQPGTPCCPSASQNLDLPFCKVPAAAEALWDRNSSSYFCLEVSDHNQSHGCNALSAQCMDLPFHPSHSSLLLWYAEDFLIFTGLTSPELPRQRWGAGGLVWPSRLLAHPQLMAEHIFHWNLCWNNSQKNLLLPPLTPLPFRFSIRHTLSWARHFTLTGVLSLLIHRLRKTALYSLQATDALKSFAEITLWKSLRKSMVL